MCGPGRRPSRLASLAPQDDGDRQSLVKTTTDAERPLLSLRPDERARPRGGRRGVPRRPGAQAVAAVRLRSCAKRRGAARAGARSAADLEHRNQLRAAAAAEPAGQLDPPPRQGFGRDPAVGLACPHAHPPRRALARSIASSTARSPISCISTSAASAGTCSTWQMRRLSPEWPGCFTTRFSGTAPQKRPDPSAYPARVDGIREQHMPQAELRISRTIILIEAN